MAALLIQRWMHSRGCNLSSFKMPLPLLGSTHQPQLPEQMVWMPPDQVSRNSLRFNNLLPHSNPEFAKLFLITHGASHTTSDPCSPKDQQASGKPLTCHMKNVARDLLLPEEQSILKAIPQYSMAQAEVRSDWPLLMHCVSISLVTSSVLSELPFFKRCHVCLLKRKTFWRRFDLVCSCIWREAVSWTPLTQGDFNSET